MKKVSFIGSALFAVFSFIAVQVIAVRAIVLPQERTMGGEAAQTARTELPEPEGILYRSNEIIVKWKAELAEDNGMTKLQRTLKTRRAQKLRDIPLKIRRDYPHRNFSVVSSEKLSAEELKERFEKLSTVQYVHENIIFRAQAETTPWGVSNSTGVKAMQAHDEGFTGSGVTIAVIDTGVDLDHPDLDANIVTGTDILNNDSDPNDDNGHGTHVAGIIAAEKNNDAGIVGVAPSAKIMPIKVLGSDGAGDYADIIAGIDYAVSHSAHVINLSLGAMNAGLVLKDMQDALNDAETAGVTVVAAAGNNASTVPFAPALFENVVAVGAVQETTTANNPDANYNTRRSYFSNFGKIAVVAPGTAIQSTWIDGQTAYSDGTSTAAPFVAGVAALLKGKNSQLTPTKIRSIMERTAQDLGTSGKDEFFGSGLVDADAALDKTTSSQTKTIIVDGNWSKNNTTTYGTEYYLEPTVYSTIIPADGSSTTTIRVRVAEDDGTPLANETVTLAATTGTLASASAVTNSSGASEFIITAPTSAGTSTVTATLSSTNITKSIVLTFADTLLVTDAGQPIDAGIEGWFFARALDGAGVYWKMSMKAYPASETALRAYDNVIWQTNAGSLNTTEQQNIQNFLDAGGHIFISGGDILYTNYYYTNISTTQPTLGVDTILSSYLKVQYKKYIASTLTFIGDTHFEGTGAVLTNFGSVQTNFGFTDTLTVLSGGTSEGYFCLNTDDALVTVASTYRSVFLGLALDGYSENDDGTTSVVVAQSARQEIINNAVDFLNTTTQRGGTFTVPSTCDTTNSSDGASEDDEGGAESSSDLPTPGLPDQLVTVGEEVIADVVLSTRTDTSVTVTWNASSTLASSLIYAQNAVSGAVESSAVGEATEARVENLIPHTVYDFIVYGVQEDGTQTAGETFRARTLPAAPAAPETTIIKRAAITVHLTDPAATGLQFRVELRNAEKTETLKNVTLKAGVAEVIFSNLEVHTTYAIRALVGYIDDTESEVLSAWSEDTKVTTGNDRIAKPTIASKDVSATQLRIRWKKPTGRVAKYKLEIWQQRGKSYVRLDRMTLKKNLKKEKQMRRLKGLLPKTTYRFRVRAIFVSGAKGRFSKYVQVTTP